MEVRSSASVAAASVGGGPRIGDYTGLPINDAARARAETSGSSSTA